MKAVIMKMTIIIIITVAVTTRLYPPHILWQSPTQEIAMRGETWSVKCIFAGRSVFTISLLSSRV